MDPELLAEARRRGIPIPGEQKKSIDPELLAEAQRRGIQTDRSKMIEDIGVQSSGAMPILNLLPENIRRAGVKGIMGQDIPDGASWGERAAAKVGEYAPPIAASMLAVNPAAGIATRAATSGASAGATRLAQESTSVGAGEQTPVGAAEEAAMTGAGFAVGEGVMGGIAEGIQKAAPFIAQGVRVLSGTKEAATLGALKNTKAFINAPSMDEAAEAYTAFERYSGLRGLGAQELESEAQMSTTELFKIATNAMKRVLKGENVDAQTLYTASQAASRLKQMSRYGEPNAAQAVGSGIVSQSKQVVDDALGKILPEYQNLREGYAAAKGKDALSSFLPQNKNLSPNVLRTTGAAFSLAEGVRSGNPIAMLAAPAISPRTYGTAIKYGYLGAPAIKAAAQLGAEAGANSLAEHYARVNKK